MQHILCVLITSVTITLRLLCTRGLNILFHSALTMAWSSYQLQFTDEDSELKEVKWLVGIQPSVGLTPHIVLLTFLTCQLTHPEPSGFISQNANDICLGPAKLRGFLPRSQAELWEVGQSPLITTKCTIKKQKKKKKKRRRKNTIIHTTFHSLPELSNSFRKERGHPYFSHSSF